MGAVHTNGAMYLGGQSNKYLGGSDDDYHDSASSGSFITIGSDTEQATITGVDGIFRTRKVGNFHYQENTKTKPVHTYQDPNNIPIKHALNGNDLTAGKDAKVKLNGKELTYENDTRSKLAGHSAYIRDRANQNAAVVNTLANIPQLAGYPFEHQVVVGQGQPLYEVGGFYTIRKEDWKTGTAKPVFDGTGNPVYATDMPLVTYLRGKNNKAVNDVMLTQPTATDAVDPVLLKLHGNPDNMPTNNLQAMACTFLLHADKQKEKQDPGFEARGYYLQVSLFDQEGGTRTGLTIRERGAQNTAWRMYDGHGNLITGIATRPLLSDYSNDESTYVKAMSAYMARNYVVYLGLEKGSPADITAAFFGLEIDASDQATATYSTESELPAIETTFMNRREADSYRRMGYLTDTDAPNYQVDVITLNIARIQELIRTNGFKKLFPSSTDHDDTVMASKLFNGLIYVHRTPRLGKTVTKSIPIHDPRMPLGYHPLAAPVQRTLTDADPVYQFTGGLYPIIGSVRTGKINTGPNDPERNGNCDPTDPKNGIWSVYPSSKQVRVKNAGTINWGGVQKSGRLQGLTVVTPNHCYIQGNYNVTLDPVKTKEGKDQYPPCGIYADGMTMLTNRWVDAKATYDKSPDGDTTTYNVSLVTNNIPTDYDNTSDEGSGGTHNLLRFLETGGREFRFLGSIVVLNRMRYGRNFLGAALGYYGAPTRKLNFNPDLLTAEGQPPFSPWGIQVTRVLSSVNLGNR